MEKTQIYSWYVIESDAIYKKMDKSFYSTGVTGIPVDIRWFFDCENDENKISIGLWFEGIRYDGILEYYPGSYNKRTRLHTKKFFAANKDKLLKYDNILFSKINPHEYQIKLFNTSSDSNIIEDPFETKVIIKNGDKSQLAYYTTKYERFHDIKEAVIKIHGTKCEICGFDFQSQYGALGKNFIDIHHLKPLYNLKEEIVPNVEKDFISICTNCHRIIHTGENNMITPEELKRLIEEKEFYNDLFR